jgi:hypothetical protein
MNSFWKEEALCYCLCTCLWFSIRPRGSELPSMLACMVCMDAGIASLLRCHIERNGRQDWYEEMQCNASILSRNPTSSPSRASLLVPAGKQSTRTATSMKKEWNHGDCWTPIRQDISTSTSIFCNASLKNGICARAHGFALPWFLSLHLHICLKCSEVVFFPFARRALGVDYAILLISQVLEDGEPRTTLLELTCKLQYGVQKLPRRKETQRPRIGVRWSGLTVKKDGSVGNWHRIVEKCNRG